jgi:hypothetical protein
MGHRKQADNRGGAQGDESIEREESDEVHCFVLCSVCVHTCLIICLHTLEYYIEHEYCSPQSVCLCICM